MAGEITYALAALIVGVVLAVVGQSMVRNVGRRKTWTFVGLALAGFGGLAIAGVIPALSGLNAPLNFGGQSALSVGDDSSSATFAEPSGTVCTANTGTTVTFAGVNKESQA